LLLSFPTCLCVDAFIVTFFSATMKHEYYGTIKLSHCRVLIVYLLVVVLSLRIIYTSSKEWHHYDALLWNHNEANRYHKSLQ
jgi:hypothetical protein